MKRIDRREISAAIFVAIRCAPKKVTDRLRGKLPMENDTAARELTDLIMRVVDTEHRGVFDWAPPAPNLFPTLDACPAVKGKNASTDVDRKSIATAACGTIEA